MQKNAIAPIANPFLILPFIDSWKRPKKRFND